MQYFCSPEEAYEAISSVVIECVGELLKVGKVTIPFIKGNHDEDKITTLGFWINELFKDHPNFNCNKSRRQRKYYHNNNLLLGFAHGDKEKRKMNEMPLIMAQEKPQEWANSKTRKFFLGDLHHNHEFKFMQSKDFVGASVEFLRSIGCSDSYHDSNGWIGVPKSASATIYNTDASAEWNLRINF